MKIAALILNIICAFAIVAWLIGAPRARESAHSGAESPEEILLESTVAPEIAVASSPIPAVAAERNVVVQKAEIFSTAQPALPAEVPPDAGSTPPFESPAPEEDDLIPRVRAVILSPGDTSTAPQPAPVPPQVPEPEPAKIRRAIPVP